MIKESLFYGPKPNQSANKFMKSAPNCEEFGNCRVCDLNEFWLFVVNGKLVVLCIWVMPCT